MADETLSTTREVNESEQKLIDEARQYCRHTMQIWVQWFVFFLTVNYVAMGWFASKLADRTIKRPMAVWAVGALFVFQNFLGIGITLKFTEYFGQLDQSIALKYQRFRLAAPPLPIRMYSNGVRFGVAAMALVIGIWIVIGIITALHG